MLGMEYDYFWYLELLYILLMRVNFYLFLLLLIFFICYYFNSHLLFQTRLNQRGVTSLKFFLLITHEFSKLHVILKKYRLQLFNASFLYYGRNQLFFVLQKQNRLIFLLIQILRFYYFCLPKFTIFFYYLKDPYISLRKFQTLT